MASGQGVAGCVEDQLLADLCVDMVILLLTYAVTYAVTYSQFTGSFFRFWVNTWIPDTENPRVDFSTLSDLMVDINLLFLDLVAWAQCTS
jgi:hypothetical protein